MDGVEPTKMAPARFLNVDLDVKSRRSLAPLLTVWPWASVFDKVEGRAPLWIYFSAPGRGITAENTAKELLRLIARLRGDALRCWESAHDRVFDIGIRAPGPNPRRSFGDVQLSVETLKRIPAAGARIQVSVYPAEVDDGCEDWPPKKPKRKASKRR
jgi:hypothetical protein